MEQPLATIEVITNKRPHPNADRLDLVNILGFQCVTEKGLYEDGTLVVYVRTDTLLPFTEWAEGYRKYSPDRVRAVKLREAWSEGIIVPIENIKWLIGDVDSSRVGEEVSELISVTKFVEPEPVDGRFMSKILPHNMKATNEDRWENIEHKLPYGEKCDLFLKVDGFSTTAKYKLDTDTHGLSTRHGQLYLTDDNIYSRTYNKFKLADKLEGFSKKEGVSIALRGELYGQGTKKGGKNPHSSLPTGFMAFSTYLMDERRYARKGDKYYSLNVARELDIEHVPLIEENVILTKELILKYSEELKTINGVPFEGIVVQYAGGSFKIINKHYDSKK